MYLNVSSFGTGKHAHAKYVLPCRRSPRGKSCPSSHERTRTTFEVCSTTPPNSESSWCPSIIFLSAFQEKTARKGWKRLPKVPKKNSCRLHANCSNSVVLSFAVQPPTICEQNDKNVLIHVDGEVPLRASRSVVVFSGLRILRITHFIPRFTRFSCASLHFLLFLLCFVTCFLW